MQTKPIATFGQWDVYPDYIVCERASYELTLANLTSNFDWPAHMALKTWCNLVEFCQARRELLAMANQQEAA